VHDTCVRAGKATFAYSQAAAATDPAEYTDGGARGVVYRMPKPSGQQDHWTCETANIKTQLEQLEIEFAQARAERRAKLQAQIENLNKQLNG
jgi:hypothetical protein